MDVAARDVGSGSTCGWGEYGLCGKGRLPDLYWLADVDGEERPVMTKMGVNGNERRRDLQGRYS